MLHLKFHSNFHFIIRVKQLTGFFSNEIWSLKNYRNSCFSLMFSCGLNGQIFSWDTDTLQNKDKLNVEGTRSLKIIHYRQQELWCCKSN